MIDAGRFDDAISQMDLSVNGDNEIYYTLMKIEINIIETDYLSAKRLIASITGKELSDLENAYLMFCRSSVWYHTKPLTEYSEILILMDKDLSLLKKSSSDNVILLSKYYLLKSSIHRELGLIKLSVEIIDLIFPILIEGINDALLMQVMISKGHLLRLQGEYNKSMDAFSKSSKLNKIIKNPTRQMNINANIGLIHLSKLQYVEAKSYLFKALTNFASPFAKAEILINIFYINFKEGRIDFDTLDLLEELSQFNPEIEKIQLVYEFAQGLIHFSKPRLSDKINALPIFEKLMQYDKDPEFQLWNMNFYCELLLDEYLAYRDLNVRTELSELVDKLIITATANNLYNSLVIGYLLKSKLYLIDSDLDKALLNLNKSTKIAKSKDFQVMLIEISGLTEEINNIVFSWQKLAEEGSRVIKESEEARIMSYLEDIVKILKM
jgi:tetratricopeptide (TPR) repeat protein